MNLGDVGTTQVLGAFEDVGFSGTKIICNTLP